MQQNLAKKKKPLTSASHPKCNAAIQHSYVRDSAWLVTDLRDDEHNGSNGSNIMQNSDQSSFPYPDKSKGGNWLALWSSSKTFRQTTDVLSVHLN